MTKEDLLIKEKILAHFDSLTEEALPDALRSLDDDQLQQLEVFLDAVLEKERAGLDNLFTSITHTMKFIPNLLLQTITAKYIEPPIAARITAKLTMKQSVAIANGLSADYVAETNRYMEAHHAAELLHNMSPKKARVALAVCLEKYPERALDVMSCLPDSVLKKLVSKRDLKNLSDSFDELGRSQLLALL